MSARLHILLPVHNRRAVTVRFVEALAKQTLKGFQLVLIDDGSTDGTAEAVRAVLPDTVVITGKGDWWWAGSLDQGCRLLERTGVRDYDMVLFINDDLTLEDDFLERAMAEVEPASGMVLLARQLDAVTREEVGYGGGVHVDVAQMRFAATDVPEEINCLPTRGIFMRWRDFRVTGGFRPKHLPHYLSDYEFTYRAWRNGLRLKVAETASVGVQLERSGESISSVLKLKRGMRFRVLFSQRFKNNPLTWLAFVRMTAPPARRPYLWVKIWGHFGILALRCLVAGRQ